MSTALTPTRGKHATATLANGLGLGLCRPPRAAPRGLPVSLLGADDAGRGVAAEEERRAFEGEHAIHGWRRSCLQRRLHTHRSPLASSPKRRLRRYEAAR